MEVASAGLYHANLPYDQREIINKNLVIKIKKFSNKNSYDILI